MNASVRWIRDLLPGLELETDEIADRLTRRGFPVEGRERPGEGLESIVVARVERVREHPDADRLQLCDVDGGDGVVQVVCGAPNVEAGRWYPFAPVGAVLPGGMKIRKAKLRGQKSVGMLCSEKEVGLGTGSDGLMTLHGSFEPGLPFVSALGLDDVRLDVEVTSNRPDLLSHRGMVRELLGPGDGPVELPPIPGEEPTVGRRIGALDRLEGESEAEAGGVGIRIADPERCPRYLGLVVRGVQVGPSPAWLQRRMRAVGARPINNVVDATNHVLQELGQPLHAFDLDRIEGRRIVVRRAEKGETLRTLDGVERTLDPEMLAICDAERPLAVAGVMGGEDSEVTADTTELLLECALFAPAPIRATRKALGLSTDASYRFERGVDPEGLHEALVRCARLVVAVAGGQVDGPILDVSPVPHHPSRVTLRPERVEGLLGVRFEVDRIIELLEPLGFTVESAADGTLSVGVPGWRSWDVTREVDLIEEIARTHGYDRFPEDLGSFRPSSVPDDPHFELEDRLRDALCSWGIHEAQTPSFAPEGEGEVEVLNPVSRDERWLRESLLPGLLRRIEYNLARGNRDVRLFELGTTFEAGEPGELPAESARLGVVLHGRRRPEHWSEAEAPVDAWELKGLMERIAAVVWHGQAGVVVDDAGPQLRIETPDGSTVGTGERAEVAGRALPAWAGPIWTIEVTLPADVPRVPDTAVRPLPQQPGTDRDLALLVPDELPVGVLLDHLSERRGALLRDLRVFDVYRGEGVPAGTRSVGVRLHFRADDRTLTDREVDEVVGGLCDLVEEELGVEIRGR